MNLTIDQTQALDQLDQWMRGNSLFSGLFGFAGTGKTTLLKMFIDKYSNKKIYLCAPTHKALYVMKEKVNLSEDEVKYATIQSFLGIKPDLSLLEFDLSKVKFSVRAVNKFNNCDLLVIDECSMINKNLFEYIKRKALDFRCKVLFLGDPFQAPPIFEKQSPVFEIEDSNNLTQIVRQAESSSVIRLSSMIRQADNQELILNNYRDNYLIIDSNKEKVLEEYLSGLTDNSKIITWTNNSVEFYNNYVRDKLGFKNEYLVQGERITIYGSGYDKLNNGDDYIIKYLNREEIIDYNPFTRKKDLSLIVIKCELNNGVKFNVIDRDSFPIFFQLNKEYIIKCNNSKNKVASWESYHEWKNKYMLLETLKDGPFTITKDFNYGYAITTHKSQGSTYDRVLVDYANIKTNRNISERNKLFYVGATRTSDKLFIYN